jgi:hypothetical protein
MSTKQEKEKKLEPWTLFTCAIHMWSLQYDNQNCLPSAPIITFY